MDLITPGIGLLFWMFISFGIVVFILGKTAWKPIIKALRERENSIDSALQSAELARKDMAKLHDENEKIMATAKKERDSLLKEAKEFKEDMIKEAKEQAALEAKNLIDSARINLQNEKTAAINEIKVQIAKLSVEIAEKILKQKLSESKDHKDLIENLIKDVKLN